MPFYEVFRVFSMMIWRKLPMFHAVLAAKGQLRTIGLDGWSLIL
jgi:hypothetical protein